MCLQGGPRLDSFRHVGLDCFSVESPAVPIILLAGFFGWTLTIVYGTEMCIIIRVAGFPRLNVVQERYVR
jgi:hypothetical protein